MKKSAEVPVDIQLGRIMKENSIKVVDVLLTWDTNNDGSVGKKEFRKHVLAMGVQASNEDIDSLFNRFNTSEGDVIDISDLLGSANTQTAAASTNLIKLMARALYRIPNMAMGRAAFYMNRTVHSGMSIAALDKSQNVLSIQEGLSQFGSAQSYLSFLGVPLRRVDALINSEARVV